MNGLECTNLQQLAKYLRSATSFLYDPDHRPPPRSLRCLILLVAIILRDVPSDCYIYPTM